MHRSPGRGGSGATAGLRASEPPASTPGRGRFCPCLRPAARKTPRGRGTSGGRGGVFRPPGRELSGRQPIFSGQERHRSVKADDNDRLIPGSTPAPLLAACPALIWAGKVWLRMPGSAQSPKQVPTCRAAWIHEWSRGTSLRLPATWSSGTGSDPSPRAATITPKMPRRSGPPRRFPGAWPAIDRRPRAYRRAARSRGW